MVGTSQRGLTILYATEAAARMIVNYKKPQITRINDVESLLHSANLSELNSALALLRISYSLFFFKSLYSNISK